MFFQRLVHEPASYDTALTRCSVELGSELITLLNAEKAFAALPGQAPNYAAVAAFRTDAEHNQTCFRDDDGNKVDLAHAGGVGVDLHSDGQVDQSLVVSSGNGAVAAVEDGTMVGTVCQYPLVEVELPYIAPRVRATPINPCVYPLNVSLLFAVKIGHHRLWDQRVL